MNDEMNMQPEQSRIEELENRLAEAEQLIEAIRCGEVDAFALNKDNGHEIYTLESGDYAYRLLIENLNEGALNLSESGIIVYTNQYFCQLINLSYEEVIGRDIIDFIHTDSRENFSALFKKSLAGPGKGEINFFAGEKFIPAYVSLISLAPRLSTIGMVITDLTEKKRSEKKLESAYAELEEKITELAKSNIELASFSYVASHDLQEPLRKIQTFSSRILEKENDNLSESGKGMFKRMQQSAQRMQLLIQDLLAYSHLNISEQEFRSFHIQQILDEVKEELAEEIALKNAVIECTADAEICMIPFQFRQLLSNLVQNALKFSKPDLPPLILIESYTDSGVNIKEASLDASKKYCVITVTDNGIGFEQDYNERIFELFQRLHEREKYEGTGIGLAIVKRIVENHKGFITAEGKPGEGAVFTIYLPVNE